MKLMIEAIVAAFIAVFFLNFMGLSVATLGSMTSFAVILLIIVLIEEKLDVSNRRVLKKMRLEQPILVTAAAFAVIIILSLVFSTIHDRVGALIEPLVQSANSWLGLIGLAVVLAVAYRLFYHFMFKQIDLAPVKELGGKYVKGRE